MSASLRSLLDFLRSPLRLWRRGRRLPARVQVTLLMAGGLSLAVVFAVWTVARATPQEEAESAADGQAIYEQVHHLRTVEKDLAAAQAVALEFLNDHPEPDLGRQMVYFEYGLTLFDAQNWPAASPAFQALVAEYADTALDRTSPDFVVDDAAYYGAVTQHYHGDKARGIALYEAFLQDFPESNRRPKALLMLAGAHEQTGDLPAALPVFEQLAREHPESEYAPESQIHVGHIRLGRKEYAAAAAAFEAIAERWPQSKHVPTALQFANRARIHEELDDWEPKDGEVVPGTVDHCAAIEANAAAFVRAYADRPECPAVLLDLINYYTRRCWWNQAVRDDAQEKIVATARTMQRIAPDDRATLRATLDLAANIYEEDLDGARALIQSVTQAAQQREDESLYIDARFTDAVILVNTGNARAGAAIWQELLARGVSPILEGELKLLIGCRHEELGEYDAARALFEEIGADERYDENLRAAAWASVSRAYDRAHRPVEALAAIEKTIELFPNTVAAKQAVRERDILRRVVADTRWMRGE
jgi:TolA-binding protein